MRANWCWNRPGRWRANRALCLLVVAVALAAAPAAQAGAPDWLKAAAREALPTYPEDTVAVMLLDEQITTVSDSGEIKTRYRRAYKILRPQGRGYGTVSVYFDNDTRLTYLKAWCLPAQGKEYEVKEKDAVETSPFGGVLYEDTRYKVLSIPAPDPGSVVGYEYEQRQRPYALQDEWNLQRRIPVRRSRFALELPKGWEFEAAWLNHPEQEPEMQGGNRWVWAVSDVPPIEPEPAMPPPRAVAGRLVVTLYPLRASLQEKSHRSWDELSQWYLRLAEGRRQATPGIQQKVAELTAGADDPWQKIQALASFLQREIRYVAIEEGIGGWQPHAAGEVFSNRYGDCKDKATLLSTMLKEVGVDSFYVSIHTDRGMVGPGHPPGLAFNHRILAIRLPEGIVVTDSSPVIEHPRFGRLLFFDPTDSITPLGLLPGYAQANYGLVSSEEGGELVRLPLQAPATNSLQRTARLTLSPTGTLSGEVEETRSGSLATARRASLLTRSGPERRKVLESFLSGFLPGFTLQGSQVENLEEYDQELVLRYKFLARDYAKTAGDLLLVRPRVIGQKASGVLEWKRKGREERRYPLEFDSAELHRDVFEIELPPGYVVDEAPPPVKIENDFAAYQSRVEVEGSLLRYRREYVIKDVRVPVERLEEMKKFYRQVAADERASVVLKRGSTTAAR